MYSWSSSLTLTLAAGACWGATAGTEGFDDGFRVLLVAMSPRWTCEAATGRLGFSMPKMHARMRPRAPNCASEGWLSCTAVRPFEQWMGWEPRMALSAARHRCAPSTVANSKKPYCVAWDVLPQRRTLLTSPQAERNDMSCPSVTWTSMCVMYTVRWSMSLWGCRIVGTARAPRTTSAAEAPPGLTDFMMVLTLNSPLFVAWKCVVAAAAEGRLPRDVLGESLESESESFFAFAALMRGTQLLARSSTRFWRITRCLVWPCSAGLSMMALMAAKYCFSGVAKVASASSVLPTMLRILAAHSTSASFVLLTLRSRLTTLLSTLEGSSPRV
eukprot:PhM_4_TR8410/c3_g8_i1/m.8148